MKTRSDVVRQTFQDYKNKQPATLGPTSNAKAPPQVGATPTTGETPATKVDLSDKARDLASQPTVATHAATSVATQTLTAGAKALLISDDKKNDDEEVKAEAVATKKPEVEAVTKNASKGNLKKPGIFFIKGLELFSSSTDYGGLDRMTEATSGARLYSWDQQDDILEEIKKRKPDQPIVLVGHSFGGDSAVEIAEKLNTLENGFRRVDLLVTIDSVGAKNDIVPANVKQNLNFFGEKSWFLNDGPNVARNINLTNVINELRAEKHTELDDTQEIQFKIMTQLNEVLAKGPAQEEVISKKET